MRATPKSEFMAVIFQLIRRGMRLGGFAWTAGVATVRGGGG